MGGAFYFLFISNNFYIKEVNITGLKTVPEEQVMLEVNNIFSQKKFVFLKSRNYFIFSTDKMRAHVLGTFPKIGEIYIRKNPEALEIIVEERGAVGVWCSVGECFYFDKKGVIFEQAPRSTGSLILAVEDERNFDPSLGATVLTSAEIIFLEEAKGLIQRNFPFNARLFVITKKSEFEFLTSENWRVFLNKKESPQYQLSNLKYLLDEEIKNRRRELDYVDLRLGNKVYYKYGETID